MDILVTGGTGFIGNHLCRQLLRHGHKVTCIDNNFTGSVNNIKDCFEFNFFDYIEHDVINIFDTNKNFDQIYHLACPASPISYQADPINTLKTNFIGTLNILELAKKKGARFLLTSTSEIYGDPEVSPQPEDYRGNVNTIGPRSCYDEGKRVAETLTTEYKNMYCLETRIARIFNTYGPKMNEYDGRVISNFIRQCSNNEEITVYGNGEQTRSFCYVSDTVDGLIRLMNSNIDTPVNIGNPNEITINKLAAIIKNLTRCQSKIIYKPIPIDDPKRRNPDITKAIKYLNWQPSISLEEGIKQML
jgi:UDP-glucuronate decarboxylase